MYQDHYNYGVFPSLLSSSFSLGEEWDILITIIIQQLEPTGNLKTISLFGMLGILGMEACHTMKNVSLIQKDKGIII